MATKNWECIFWGGLHFFVHPLQVHSKIWKSRETLYLGIHAHQYILYIGILDIVNFWNKFASLTYHPVPDGYHKTAIVTQIVLRVVSIHANIVGGLLTESLTAKISLSHPHLLLPAHCHLVPEQCQR